MKEIIKDEKYGEIIYNENAWTGKKGLSISNKALEKVDRSTFKMEDGKEVKLSGNYFSGVKLNIDSDTIVLSQGLKWYEYVLSFLPFILILIWGNSVALCEIVPIVGGFVGGLISAVFSFLNLIILKKLKNIWLKVFVSIVTLGLTFLVCFLIALAILGAVA